MSRVILKGCPSQLMDLVRQSVVQLPTFMGPQSDK